LKAGAGAETNARRFGARSTKSAPRSLHVFGQKIANNFAEIPALLLRDTLQTLLQLTVKVDWQTQAAALPVKLAPLRFGKVGMRFIV